MTTEEKMEVMKAFIEGKTIQCKRVDCNDWYDCNPAWDWPTFEYRVKPEAPEKSSRAERHEMASAVSNAVWEELMARAKNIEGPINPSMVGFGFNDISDIVLNKILEYKSEKIKAYKYEMIKALRTERVKMADSVSSAVWKELMDRAKTIEGPVTMTMVGFGFNDISDIVLNKILDYKPEDKAQDMNYSIDDCIDTLKSFTDWGSNAGWNALYKAVITYLNSIKELKEENEKLRKECIARRNSEEDFKWERDQYKKERDELATCLGPAEDNTERNCDESVDEKVPTSEPAEMKDAIVKKVRRMTYKEVEDWLIQCNGLIRIDNKTYNNIYFECEDRNKAVRDGIEICGHKEYTWHEPMIEE